MFITANGYLYASYYCHDGRLRYPTGIKAPAKSKGDKIKLDMIEKEIAQYEAHSKILQRDILKNDLYSHLDEVTGRVKKSKASFFGDWEQMTNDMRSGALLKPDGNKYSPKSAKNYDGVKKVLEKYQVATGSKIDYRITIDDYRSLLRWLISVDYSRNQIANIIAKLGSFLAKMKDVKRHNNEVYKLQEFGYSWEESDTVALTEDELKSIYGLNLSGARERARDVFIFACWVALRAEDLSRINEYKRRGNVIEVLTNKTGEKVIIPIHWMADAIYTKYNGVLPVYSTPEGLNYHLPSICEDAGIVEQRLSAITKGGQRQAKYYKKCDLISVHTARRTFATIMYMQRFPTKAIMKITGHKTERAFLTYIRIDKEEAADMMLESSFFKKPS